MWIVSTLDTASWDPERACARSGRTGGERLDDAPRADANKSRDGGRGDRSCAVLGPRLSERWVRPPLVGAVCTHAGTASKKCKPWRACTALHSSVRALPAGATARMERVRQAAQLFADLARAAAALELAGGVFGQTQGTMTRAMEILSMGVAAPPTEDVCSS